MGQVLIRNLDDGVIAAYRSAAVANRRSLEAELRDALARASDNLDVARVDEVLSRWHSRATIVANPLTEEEREAVRRARAGDPTGLRSRDEHDGWSTL